ncbi:MAG: PQQ-binding-like beta-propeller repeat protein [Planctomycetota bacterium]
MMTLPYHRRLAFLLATLFAISHANMVLAESRRAIQLVVMDPLSKPLACDCVRGYAQRDYQVLAEKLREATARDVEVVWHDSLAEAMKETHGVPDIIIGKHSVVLADAGATALQVRAVGALTGKTGETSQRGLIVVRDADPAQELQDLAGYEVLFGPEEAEEKSGAAERLLSEANIPIQPIGARFGACSEAAANLLSRSDGETVAAVISSYAEPLLKGCGSIREGELRVVAETEEVPFITAFLNESMEEALAETIEIALLTLGTDPVACEALETLSGFLPIAALPSLPAETSSTQEVETEAALRDHAQAWPQFRGRHRDGRVDWLPSELMKSADDFQWQQELPSDGLAGIAIADDRVFLAGRDASDQGDLLMALDLATGKPQWSHGYPAACDLDYGNSPRATPLFAGGTVYFLGATGVLTAMDANTGQVIWQVDLADRFGEALPTWGFCSSPLHIEGRIILNVGRRHPTIAFDAETGETLWAKPGRPAGYSSLVATSVHDQSVVIGTDQLGYFARKVSDGDYAWLAKRQYSGDFAVPAPVLTANSVIFTGENNGIELYRLPRPQEKSRGKKVDAWASNQIAVTEDLAPDSHTPVAVGERLFVTHQGVHALDITNELRPVWSCLESEVTKYASIIASSDRLLVTSEDNALYLLRASDGHVLDQIQLAEDAPSLLSHPALSGSKLVLRIGAHVRCYQLAAETSAHP